MDRLISADALKTELWKERASLQMMDAQTADNIMYGIYKAEICVSKMPTVDAEPVVRCKECKHASLTYDGECKYCQRWKEKHDGESISLYLDGDFYCAFGERREDGNNDRN